MRRCPAALVLLLAASLAGCGRPSVVAYERAAGPLGACLARQAPPQRAPSTGGMAFIRGGAFDMGARPLRPEEGPAHRTRVDSFWIDRTDVTNADFARFVAATGYVTLAERAPDPRLYPGVPASALKPSGLVFVGSQGRGDGPEGWWRVVPGADWRHPQGPGSSIAGQETLPVVQVGWADAMAYARWLGRDLPTEAEWEYAARGGRNGATFVWGERAFDPRHPQANVWQGVFPTLDLGQDGYKARAAPVGCFPANGYGLYDMAGNVWQWTRDSYPGGRAPEDAEGAAGDPTVREHVIKGGSFLCSPDFCFRYRPAARQPGPTDTGGVHIGFRTVLRLDGHEGRQALARVAADERGPPTS